jgi:UDP-glucose 4-epimerase
MSGVLVTGATTPLGRSLTRAVLDEPDRGPVLAVGLEETGFAEAEHHARLFYRSIDLRRPRDTHDLLFGPVRDLGIDTVVHAAFHRNVRDFGPHAHALHVEATRELVDLVDRHPTLERFVFLSSSSVYRIDPRRASLIAETDPLDLSPDAPAAVRDRVEADLTVCTRMGLTNARVLILRAAEILAEDVGSQLHDYLQSRLCLRPLGFDPMLNVLSLPDVTRALMLATRATTNGVFNVPGADTLPLSSAVERYGRRCIAIPGPLLAPLYRVRASMTGMEFRYDLNHRRFHFSAVLDGSRAKKLLGYEPTNPIAWPGSARAAHVEKRGGRSAGPV